MPKPARNKNHIRPDLAQSILLLARAIHESLEVAKHHLVWLQEHMGGVSKKDLDQIRSSLKAVTAKQKIMAQTQAELLEELKVISAQQKKTQGEIATVKSLVDSQNAKIAELEALIAAGGQITKEITDLVTEIRSTGQSIDDELPDAEPPPPEPAVRGRR